MANYIGNDAGNTYNGTSSADKVLGLGGNDSLSGGDGNDWIYGGEGNDLIRGEDDNDHLYGENGDDQIYGHQGNDMIYGGAGNDYVQAGSGVDWVYGGEGNDKIEGYTGNDVLHGENGNDVLNGDDGDDKLYGGAGNDSLSGGYGDDLLEGGDGDDLLESGGGDNTLLGGNGNDKLTTGGNGAWLGPSTFRGGAGNDSYHLTDRVSNSIFVDDAVPTIIEAAGEGHDTIHLSSFFYNEMSEYTLPANVEDLTAYRAFNATLGADSHYVRIVGNALNNTIIGTKEDDRLDGGDGNDRLFSRDTSDVGVAKGSQPYYAEMLIGGKGDDLLVRVDKADNATLYGGAGNDIYELPDEGYAGTVWSSFTGWEVRESAGEGYDIVNSKTASTFLWNHVEELNYKGSAANTNLWGNEIGNKITGGNDSADNIKGFDGDDVLDGGTGNAPDTIDGGNGNDVLRGWAGSDSLRGGSGNDSLFGGAGPDNLFGDAGNDLMYGDDDVDWLYAGAGDDQLFGGAGGDDLRGEAGNDTIQGGEGNDFISGGVGVDRVFGGNGNDTFRYQSLAESPGTVGNFDYIMDFTKGQDKIDLRDIDAKPGVFGDQAFTFLGYDVPELGVPGQVWVMHASGATWVQADVNGDAVGDFMVQLVGTIPLTAEDFML